jgi:hypothetical protein
MRRLMLAALALATTALAAAPPPNAAAPDRAQLEQRLVAVETLIERSSAAKQIEASAVPAALERRERARASHSAAAEALRAGDLARTATLLPEASALMFEAVRLAAPEQVTTAKRGVDFQARLESARSLLGAQRRIAGEKSPPGASETTRTIERLLQQAESDARAGNMEKAGIALEQGYLLAKAAIGSMRGGDTLVRSLDFGSPEEEYRYELDRNETHRMLLSVLLDPSKTQRATPAIERAAGLRRQAEGAAGTRDFAGAIRMLEDSTRELVRAIRAAGVYIPG